MTKNSGKISLFIGVALLVVAAWYLFYISQDERQNDVVVVRSDDGALTLSIPKDALPAGVSFADISATRVKSEDNQEAPLYRLLPDGVEFLKPISFSLNVPYTDEKMPFVLVGREATHEIESPEISAEINREKQSINITGGLSHFSFITVLNHSVMIFLDTSSADVIVGDKARVSVGVKQVDSGPRHEESDLFYKTTQLVGDYKFWGVALKGDPKIISPERYTNVPIERMMTKNDEVSVTKEFTCIAPGYPSISYHYAYEGIVRATDIPKEFLAFIGGLIAGNDEDIIIRGNYFLTPERSFSCLNNPIDEMKNILIPGGGETKNKESKDSRQTIEVIDYKGKQLLVSSLIIENEEGCGAPHWHAKEGSAIATDGSQVSDPGPQCGYGKVRDIPTRKIELR